MTAFIRKHGVATTIYFPLIKAGSNNFAVAADYTYVAGDVKISKDGGTSANPTNSPSAIVMGNGASWKLDLTATEMQAKSIVITFIDAAIKAIEDQEIIIETYGDGQGELNIRDFVDAILKTSVSGVEASAAEHSLTTLILSVLESSISSTTWTIKRTDGVTTHFTKTLTVTPGANPITGVT